MEWRNKKRRIGENNKNKDGESWQKKRRNWREEREPEQARQERMKEGGGEEQDNKRKDR